MFLLIFAFILTSLSPTDLFPRFIRNEVIVPYALKVLPCIVIWLRIQYMVVGGIKADLQTLNGLGQEALD